MPYISKVHRKDWDKVIKEILETVYIDTEPGILNYIITKILIEALGETPNYKRYNEIIGVLECCKLELYRRKISEYENSKIELNGDVYE